MQLLHVPDVMIDFNAVDSVVFKFGILDNTIGQKKQPCLG